MGWRLRPVFLLCHGYGGQVARGYAAARQGKNIRWKVRLKGWSGNGQPVFGPGRVLVVSEPDVIRCFSTADGSLLCARLAKRPGLRGLHIEREAT
jgi:hypothetical protein